MDYSTLTDADVEAARALWVARIAFLGRRLQSDPTALGRLMHLIVGASRETAAIDAELSRRGLL